MEKVSYAEFSLNLLSRTKGQRIPMGGSIEVTRRCPLRCVHCYNNLPLEDHPSLQYELTFDEHCRILDEMAEAGCLWLLFTGGEIFCRKDFLDIYAHAMQRGFLITLFTNGTLIDEVVAGFLAERRPFSIEITIHGRTRETYERISGIPGSYDRCLRGIRLLRERDLPLRLKTVVLTMNRHEILEIKRWVEEELGLKFRFDAMVNPRLDCSRGPLRVRLKPQEVVELDFLDPKRVEAWRRFDERFHGPVHLPEKVDDLYHCGAGVHEFALDPYGMLSICPLSYSQGYDLRKGSFREGWDHFLLQMSKKKITRRTKCVSCEIKAMCGMCPSNGTLECNDPEEPVDFLCQVAHLRAKALGFPVKEHGECEYCQET
jgi:radical SAM protein with 4Fe4S-binding SPASM domain